MLASSREITALLVRVGEGDSEAFDTLYRATHLKLFGICVRILRRKELAEEILQDVYVRVWNHAGDFDAARASPISWMAAIARNRSLDEVRRRRPVFADDMAGVEQISDDARDPEEQLEVTDELKRLEDCLGKLDDQRREAVRLAYLDGLSRADLAKRYEKPLGTVKTWLHRGLKQLKECLER